MEGKMIENDLYLTMAGGEMCISCIHWDKVSKKRLEMRLSLEYISMRDGKDLSQQAKWCERQDKPMFYDEWSQYHEPMKELNKITLVKSERKRVVGFNGRVKILVGERLDEMVFYEEKAFGVVKEILENGEHACYKINTELSKEPYPCEDKNCTIRI